MIGPFEVSGYHVGEALELLRKLPDESIDCCVTSPPYWGLRDYGVSGQRGLEATPEEYVASMVEVFREVRRVLTPRGTCWLNLGDCYATGGGRVGEKPGGGKQGEAWRLRGVMTPPNRMPIPGLKAKDLVGAPWRVAFALQADGWYLRSDIVWHKTNAMPESVRDRPTKAHEYLFFLTKSYDYFYDADAIREPHAEVRRRGRWGKSAMRGRMASPRPRGNGGAEGYQYDPRGRNKRTVWDIAVARAGEAHFAIMPDDLVRPCVLAGCPAGGIVLDPFGGSGTVGKVAEALGRRWLLFDLNPGYAEIARRRTAQVCMAVAR